jgi:hypothetical protein
MSHIHVLLSHKISDGRLKIQFHGCELKQQQRIKQKAYGIALFSA